MKPTWIRSAPYDLLWFIAPMALPPLLIWFFPNDFIQKQRTELFPWSWIIIVLLVDVAHVYSTVYKTYFKPSSWKKYGTGMRYLPLIVWVIGMICYSIHPLFFWSLVAYFAVFHFIRQQYGFFKLYTRGIEVPKKRMRLLLVCIYGSMVLPLVMWHCLGQRNFNWMMEGDFVLIRLPVLLPYLQVLYCLLGVFYVYLEFLEYRRTQMLMWGRFLLTLSTGFSYYVSMVATNNDFMFTLINVLGHGIPYFALVWHSERQEKAQTPFLKLIFSQWGWVLFFLILVVFSYVEESAWDVFIWRENSATFGWLYDWFKQLETKSMQAIFASVLIVPQIVHYILDGMIWKKKQLRIESKIDDWN